MSDKVIPEYSLFFCYVKTEKVTLKDDALSRPPAAVVKWNELRWKSNKGKIHEELSHDGTSFKKSVSRAPQINEHMSA